MTDLTLELNGEPASVADLATLALVNYGHFTSMQVRDGAVRGLDLHFERLQRSTRELFGTSLDVEQVRGWMRRAAGAAANASLRINVFSRDWNRDRPLDAARPDVLITVAPPREIAQQPLRVKSVLYRRETPWIKHVGTFGLFRQKRIAQAQGFDDALFIDVTGAVAEGTIWNVGFHDGTQIVWPDAPALDGVSMQLLKAGLAEIGVPSVARRIEIGELGEFRSAFFTNTSCVVCPLASIDEIGFADETELPQLLERAWTTQPPQRL